MYFKKYSSALYLAILITLIYVVGWMIVARLSDGISLFSIKHSAGFNRATVLSIIFYLSITTFLVFIVMRSQLKKHSALESRLQFADETLEARVKIRTAEFEKYMGGAKELKGIIPICAQCKSIRNSSGQWENLEIYIQNRSEAEFSHGLCPDCDKALYGDRRLHFKAIAEKYT